MTEQEYRITKAALVEIIEDSNQSARERNRAAKTLLALEEKCGTFPWLLNLDSLVQTGNEAGSNQE